MPISISNIDIFLYSFIHINIDIYIFLIRSIVVTRQTELSEVNINNLERWIYKNTALRFLGASKICVSYKIEKKSLLKLKSACDFASQGKEVEDRE